MVLTDSLLNTYTVKLRSYIHVEHNKIIAKFN